MASLLSRETADKLKSLIASGNFGAIGGKVRRRQVSGAGEPLRYFVLAEDAPSTAPACKVYAWPGDFDPDSGGIQPKPDSTPFLLYYPNGELSFPKVARAGYSAKYAIDENGLPMFIPGACINSCETTATIDDNDMPDGQVGVAYSHTVVVSGLGVDGISSTTLPPGLTIDSETGEISGTPTTAGTYYVVLTAESDNSVPCQITKMVVVVIEPEGGPGGEEGGGEP